MYKVFINEKALFLNDIPVKDSENILFENNHTISQCLQTLENENIKSINLYHNDLELLWNEFQDNFKILSAAGGLVTNANNELLVIERLGKWDLPKGKIEEGESQSEAALREVEEECGLSKLHLENYFETTYHIYFLKEYILKPTYWYKMTYLGNGSLIPQTEESITAVKWVPFTEIYTLKSNTYQNINLLFEKFEKELN